MVSRPPSRFLISRLSAVGDCIHTMPLLCALREHFPEAFIAWVVEETAAPLLENHGCLDELVVVKRRWLKSPRRVLDLRNRLGALRPDMAFDPQGLAKSALTAWLSGAGQRIGYSGRHGRELSPWLNNCRIAATKPHVVDRYLELLTPLGIESPDVRFDVPEDEPAASMITAFLRNSHLGSGFTVLNPGAGWGSKLWPAERFAEVARHLGRQHDLPSVVTWAGDQEHVWAQRIVSKSRGHAVIAPPTTLRQLAAMLRAARMFVGSDTGPLHLAAAVGASCIGLYGVTRPEVSGPYGDGHVALQEVAPEGSDRGRRRADNVAMRAIEAPAVCDACDQVLDRQAAEQAA